MPELAPDLGPEVVGAGILLALIFLFLQFTELTLIPLLPLLFALSKYSCAVPAQLLGVNSAVFNDSGSVEGGDTEDPGEGVFRDSNLLDEALFTFGGLAQAPCNTGALVSVFTGGGGIGSGLTDDDRIGDVFLGGGTRFPGVDNVC